jgi:hypothetical protein
VSGRLSERPAHKSHSQALFNMVTSVA